MCAGDLPGRARRLGVAFVVLCIPGEALAADMPMHARMRLEESLFAGIRTPLDELHHGDFLSVTQCAGNDAEGGGRLALAVAGMNHKDAALDIRSGNVLID